MHTHIPHTQVAVDANPNDYMALAKWGELLLELAMLKQVGSYVWVFVGGFWRDYEQEIEGFVFC